jgi:hypothetical protein
VDDRPAAVDARPAPRIHVHARGRVPTRVVPGRPAAHGRRAVGDGRRGAHSRAAAGRLAAARLRRRAGLRVPRQPAAGRGRTRPVRGDRPRSAGPRRRARRRDDRRGGAALARRIAEPAPGDRPGPRRRRGGVRLRHPVDAQRRARRATRRLAGPRRGACTRGDAGRLPRRPATHPARARRGRGSRDRARRAGRARAAARGARARYAIRRSPSRTGWETAGATSTPTGGRSRCPPSRRGR